MTWRKHKCSRLSERSRPAKATYCVTLLSDLQEKAKLRGRSDQGSLGRAQRVLRAVTAGNQWEKQNMGKGSDAFSLFQHIIKGLNNYF